MTFDVRSNSPFISQAKKKEHLEGESSSLSGVTLGFFPGTPSIRLLVCRLETGWSKDMLLLTVSTMLCCFLKQET